MRLERLEISGFKSFSDRSELSFDEGVTAIVGPNGCGKSNVADALTWVLGEQSAKSLRGEKMEDVIFSGSDARKPTGAAEVRLKLSGVIVPPSLDKEVGYEPSGNGHGHLAIAEANGHAAMAEPMAPPTREVEVTRRLFRSGESEYLIDGHQVRLRDIHELLMDTGLGAKAYAIIEQGKIGMILSSRPTDRRQLIEEAAGITKYKARRRAAELKLDAAQQNLTRLDDIVFEVEKQKGALKRQAAKARRYTRLRDEMRRWEKVLFTRRYRALADAIETARMRLKDARSTETAAAARLAEVETALATLRIGQAEADAAAGQVRDEAHQRELDINRRQQQIALDRQQAGMLETRAAELDQERLMLEARREPERLALEGRRQAAEEAEARRTTAAEVARAAAEDYARAQQAIEAVEQDVERARADVYAVVNTVTALNAAVQSASAQRERAVEAERRFDVESGELQAEIEKVRTECQVTGEQLRRGQDSLDAARVARAARESELASARIEHEWRARDVRVREQELAGASARLRSLEELDAHRAGFADAARMVLVNANGRVGQMGALADFLEVEPRYERAIEACLGDLLQHVLVERLEHVSAGLRLIRQEDAGRCGFIVGRPGTEVQGTNVQGTEVQSSEVPAGTVRLQSVVRVGGPFAGALRAAMGEALIADSFDTASRVAQTVPVPVATIEGDVFRGRYVVTGGDKAEARGILGTKREIKELRERVATERAALAALADETTQFEQTIAHATAAIQALGAEIHRQEKAIVSVEAQAARAAQDEFRLQQRADLVATEIRRVREEIAGLDQRQDEALASITRLDEDKRAADEGFAAAQQKLGEARETAEGASRSAAEARAEHAALVERCAAASGEVTRMEAAAIELENRVAACARDIALMREQRERLLTGVAEHEQRLDEDVRALEGLRDDMRLADERATEVRASVDAQEGVIRDARRALDAVRALASELDISRATAESDLGHLAQQAFDAVGVSLETVREEVERMEAAGVVEPDVRAIRAAEAVEPDEEEVPAEETVEAPAPERMTAEEAIVELRSKIDRIGPVNMMAIEQHRELEERHVFLTTQRQDLVDSIAQTNEAIKRIDETTHARFREAFTAINRTSSRRSPPCSAAAAPASACSTSRSPRERHRHRRVSHRASACRA
jgi:chromosome segregation protein